MIIQTITYRYFVAEGPEAASIIFEAKAEMEAQREWVSACLKKWRADCLWGGRHSSPSGIGYINTDGKLPPMKENFLKPRFERYDGVRYAVYSPDRRYKAGKVIKQELVGVGSFRFSDYVSEKMGLPVHVFGILDGRQVMASTTAGLYGETCVIRVPVGGDGSGFEPPSMLREIKKSEFVAITEEGQ